VSEDERREVEQVKIPILIEPTSERRYRATGGGPFVVSVEAETPEAAVEKMKGVIADRVQRGAMIAELDLPCGENPWLDGAGMFRNDPFFDDWQQAITEYRRHVDQTADAP
jgi:hypothetical protein